MSVLEGDAEVVRQGVGLIGIDIFGELVVGGLPLCVLAEGLAGEQEGCRLEGGKGVKGGTHVIVAVGHHVAIAKEEKSLGNWNLLRHDSEGFVLST